MAVTKTSLEENKKTNHVICDTQHREIGTDKNDYPVLELIIEKPPLNYKFIKAYEHINVAVVEDLDYEAIPQNTDTV